MLPALVGCYHALVLQPIVHTPHVGLYSHALKAYHIASRVSSRKLQAGTFSTIANAAACLRCGSQYLKAQVSLATVAEQEQLLVSLGIDSMHAFMKPGNIP